MDTAASAGSLGIVVSPGSRVIVGLAESLVIAGITQDHLAIQGLAAIRVSLGKTGLLDRMGCPGTLAIAVIILGLRAIVGLVASVVIQGSAALADTVGSPAAVYQVTQDSLVSVGIAAFQAPVGSQDIVDIRVAGYRGILVSQAYLVIPVLVGSLVIAASQV